jgi:predicted ester cyclase
MRAVWNALPDLSITIEQMIAERDQVVVTCIIRGTHQADYPGGPSGGIKASGRQLNLPDIVVFRVVDGKIVEDWESMDFGSLWEQLGGIPSPDD